MSEGLGWVGRGGVGVGAGFSVAFPFMGRNSFAFGFNVEFFTCAAAVEAVSVRSLLSGHASSPLLGGAGCGVPVCCRPSGPEDWGPAAGLWAAAAAGAAAVMAVVVVVVGDASVVCCRSEEARREVTAGLGGAGEEEEEEEESAGGGGSAEDGLAEGEELDCSLNSLPNLRSSSSWDLCWTEGALLLFPSCGLDRLSVRSLAAVFRISFTSTGKIGVGPEGLAVGAAVTVEEEEESR